jgi:2-oxo-4-hydroxy-4-carboxy--5-ureidoimidazoline (OHCU) decarboxylase
MYNVTKCFNHLLNWFRDFMLRIAFNYKVGQPTDVYSTARSLNIQYETASVNPTLQTPDDHRESAQRAKTRTRMQAQDVEHRTAGGMWRATDAERNALEDLADEVQ